MEDGLPMLIALQGSAPPTARSGVSSAVAVHSASARPFGRATSCILPCARPLFGCSSPGEALLVGRAWPVKEQPLQSAPPVVLAPPVELALGFPLPQGGDPLEEAIAGGACGGKSACVGLGESGVARGREGRSR